MPWWVLMQHRSKRLAKMPSKKCRKCRRKSTIMDSRIEDDLAYFRSLYDMFVDGLHTHLKAQHSSHLEELRLAMFKLAAGEGDGTTTGLDEMHIALLTVREIERVLSERARQLFES